MKLHQPCCPLEFFFFISNQFKFWKEKEGRKTDKKWDKERQKRQRKRKVREKKER